MPKAKNEGDCSVPAKCMAQQKSHKCPPIGCSPQGKMVLVAGTAELLDHQSM
jgi:hypothetical protein